MEVELDARTLRAAERRIDYAQQGGGDSPMSSSGDTVARGRKASFFEELYGGYGRFRSKHLVVGLLIGAVAVAVFVAILLIVIASIRNKTDTRSSNRHLQTQETRLTSFDGTGGGGNKSQKMGVRKYSQSRESICQSATLHFEDFKETTFMSSSNQDDDVLNGGDDLLNKSCHNPTQVHSSTVDILPGGATGTIYDYSHYGALCDGDDDSSMRSDHQLIQQSNMIEGNNNSSSSNSNGNKSYYHRSRGPPSYFDLEQSVAISNSETAPRAFVNLISSGSVQEAKPDLIQTATIYSNAGAKDPNNAIFDTISFENHRGHMAGECNASGSEAYLNELGPTMIAVTGEQISGKWRR